MSHSAMLSRGVALPTRHDLDRRLLYNGELSHGHRAPLPSNPTELPVVKDILRSAGAGLIAVLLLLLALRIAGPPAPAGDRPQRGDAPVPGRGGEALRADVERLRARALRFPVAGAAPSALRDSFAESRVGHVHEAADILAPRGTRVLAVDDGRIEKLFTSVRGGISVYQFDADESYCYYYAHLDNYAPWLKEGALVRRGSLVGYVGTTGNAPENAPHLHFAVFKLGADRRWWGGTPINPFELWTAR